MAQSDLVARKVGQIAIRLYAHASWVRRHGLPLSLAELAATHQLIGYDRNPAFLRAAAAFGERLDHSAFGFRSDNDLAQLAAIRAGVGVGPGHEIVMRRDADLINVLPEFKATLEVWLATPPALRGTARVAITLDALAKGFRNLTIRDIHG